MCAAAVTAEGSGGNTRAREAGRKAKPHSKKIQKKKREKKKKRTHDISMKRSTFKFLCFEIHTSLSYLRVLLVGIQKKKKKNSKKRSQDRGKKKKQAWYMAALR